MLSDDLDERILMSCEKYQYQEVMRIGWCRCYFAKFDQLHRVDTTSQTGRKWSKCPEITLSRRVHIIFAKIYCLTPSELRERVVSRQQQNRKIIVILPKISPKSLKNVHQQKWSCGARCVNFFAQGKWIFSKIILNL